MVHTEGALSSRAGQWPAPVPAPGYTGHVPQTENGSAPDAPTALSWVEIDTHALLRNARALKARAGGGLFIAVVKSNAYGHGLELAARTLADTADWFGVNSLAEAERLRAAGIENPVIILGRVPPEDADRAAVARARVVVYDRELADALAAAAARQGVRLPVHLKVETGTNRQGLRGDDLVALARHCASLHALQVEGASMHFADVEDAAAEGFTRGQREAFLGEVGRLREADVRPSVLHAACSAALILYPETVLNAVRVGVALYGLWPSAETRREAARRAPELQLRPVLAWKTRVAQVKTVPAGETVGYGLTHRVERDARIAVLAVGYYDGYDRGLSSRGRVLVRGHAAPIVGRVCMNIAMADVTDVPGVAAGDEVVLLGRGGREAVTAEEIADMLDTINYEVVARINPELPRVPAVSEFGAPSGPVPATARSRA